MADPLQWFCAALRRKVLRMLCSPNQATVEGSASTPAPTMAQKMCMIAVNRLPVLSLGMLRGGGLS